MVVVELKLFISIILPLATILFIVKGDSRKIVTFLLFGIIAELASNLIQNYLTMYVIDDLYFTANIGPVIEEILKSLPVLIFIFARKPDKQLIYEVSIASGIGFAILENAFIIGADIYGTSLGIAFLRGIGAGMMHAVCTLAVGYGMSFIYKKRWFFIPGTFLFMFMAMVYHSIFNTLVQSPYQIIGLIVPIATFIPLIIRIIDNRSKGNFGKKRFKFFASENMSTTKKGVIKITAVVAVAAICVVSFVGIDGTRLTGGKNGIYGVTDSGMDTDDVIEAAIRTRQNEYDKMYKQEVRQEWLKEAYVNLYGEINKYANNTLTKCKLSETFAPMQVSSSNMNIVTAVANADALETSHEVCVKQMASKPDGEEPAKAIVVIDGKKFESDTNTISVSNVKYTLKSISEDDIPVIVTVKMDVDKVIENAKAFVEDYNMMISRLNELYTEEVYSDYDVLTKEQEEEMSAELIEEWNNRAKSGLLHGNQTLNKMIGKMREAMFTPVSSVDSSYNTMMSIGIYATDNTGQLGSDEIKLISALEREPGAVYQLFCSIEDPSLIGSKQYSSAGVANRLYDLTQSILKEMKSYAGTTTDVDDGSYLGNLILNLKTKMKKFEAVIDTYREKMYEKYDSMEAAHSRMQSQFESLGLGSGDY